VALFFGTCFFFRGTLYDAATIAYGQVCAPFHSWAIRKAVGAGMYTLPTREQLIVRLNETGKQTQRPTTFRRITTLPIFEFRFLERKCLYFSREGLIKCFAADVLSSNVRHLRCQCPKPDILPTLHVKC
jgi:hypothetical protein